MIEGLAKTLIEPLAARWRHTALGSSAAAWLTFVVLYVITHPDAAHCAGSSTPWCRVSQSRPVGPALLLLGALGLVAGTAFLAAGAAAGLFALLTSESWTRGRWPVARAGLLLTRWQHGKRRRAARRSSRPGATPAPPWEFGFAARRNGAFNAYLAGQYPSRNDWLRPTACGNVLAATAERIDRQLGLDLTLVWQPLLAVLPEEAVTSLTGRSSVVLARCQQLLIALGMLPLGALLPWAYAGPWLGAGVLAFLFSRQGMVVATKAFAEQVHTTVVVHRRVLYTALGLEPPQEPGKEADCGRTLTQVLAALQDTAGPPALTYHWA